MIDFWNVIKVMRTDWIVEIVVEGFTHTQSIMFKTVTFHLDSPFKLPAVLLHYFLDMTTTTNWVFKCVDERAFVANRPMEYIFVVSWSKGKAQWIYQHTKTWEFD